jgi:hypothetical protein
MMERAVVNAGMISMVAFPRVRIRGSGGNDSRREDASGQIQPDPYTPALCVCV